MNYSLFRIILAFILCLGLIAEDKPQGRDLLPSSTVRVLDKHQEELDKARQDYLVAIEKIRRETVEDLERQEKAVMREGVDAMLVYKEELLAIQNYIPVDFQGNEIEQPAEESPDKKSGSVSFTGDLANFVEGNTWQFVNKVNGRSGITTFSDNKFMCTAWNRRFATGMYKIENNTLTLYFSSGDQVTFTADQLTSNNCEFTLSGQERFMRLVE